MAVWTPLVHRIVRRYRRSVRRSDRDDLLQVGFLGLWIGLRTYQPGRGAGLKTWLWERVKREIVDYLRTAGPTSREGYPHVLQTAITFSAAVAADQGKYDWVSSHESPGFLEDALAVTDPEPACEREELWRTVAEILPPRQSFLVQLVYRHGMLQREAGERVGITQEMVSKVLTDARKKLERRLA